MQRAALDGGERVGASQASAAALADGIAALELLGGSGALRTTDPRRLLVSVMALCFFPLAPGYRAHASLGLDVDDQEFVATWVAHIVDLLTHGALADTDIHRTPSPSPGPARAAEGNR